MADVETLERTPETTVPNATRTPEQEADLARVFNYSNDGMDEAVEIDLDKVPDWFRMRVLKKALIGIIDNRVNAAKDKAKKDNASWTLYDNAGGDLQTDVAQPSDPRAVVPFKDIAERARTAFYEGQLGRRGDGEGKSKAPKDPLEAMITRVVTDEVYAKGRKDTPGYKFFTAQKVVNDAGGGSAYLKAKIEEKVADGADRATLEKTLDLRYVKRARELLGLDKVKGGEADILD